MSKENVLNELFFNHISYNELYKFKAENKLKDYHVINGKKSFLLKEKHKDKKIYLFFLNPITLIFQNVFFNETKQKHEVKNIYSSIQIEEYFNSFNISNPEVIKKDSKELYWEAKIDIERFIEDDKLIIYNNTSVYNEYLNNVNIINSNENKFNPENLSKYFYKYFLYNKKNNDNNIFEYYYSKNRDNLNSLLNVIICFDNVHFFKFCGPTSTGKSTTLLKFSREYSNIIYLNFKVIYQLEQENKIFDCYNLIIYEFGRLEFENEEYLNKFKNFLNTDCQNKPSIIIIYNILNFMKDQNCIIIFDQFKIKYIKNINFDKFEELIKSSSLKLILCSSINDKDIRNEVIKTIKYFRGNPKKLNEFSQYYYFYFAEKFFEKKSSDNKLDKIFQFFDFKPKYKFLLINSENMINTIDEIKKKIIGKINDFFSFEKDLDICKILLNLKNNINVKHDYTQFSNIIEKVPLKYYNLKLQDEYFEIDYAFKFMQILEKENITQKECIDYFQKKKYLLDKSFDGKIKGEYFEMSARFFLELNNALPQKIDNKISVKNIVNMEIFENEYNNLKKLIYESNNDGTKMDIKTSKIVEEEILSVKNLLNKMNIKNKQDLDVKYERKNIDYYLMNQALNYIVEKEKNKKQKKEDEEEDKEEPKEEQKEKQKEEETEAKKKMKEDPKEEKKSGKKKESEKIKKNIIIESKEKKDILLKKKRMRDKNNIYYMNNIKGNSLLINQEDVNGKTLDQAFIFGDENNKIFLGLQMKCLSNKVDHFTTLKSINKENIKQNCQNILLRCILNLNIEIKEWHYILVAYYNKNEIDNTYCKQLERHCKRNDLEIVYFNPEEQLLYDKEFKKIKNIKISNKSNLDYEFPESNPYNLICIEETNDLINSYYNERIAKLNIKNYYNEQENFQNSFKNWLQTINKEPKDIIKDLKELCGNKFKLVDYYELNNKFSIPAPNKGYMFLFKNKNKTNVVCYYRKDGLKAFDLENKEDIIIIQLPIYIDFEEKLFFVFSF